MPDGVERIKALSYREVDKIVQKFERHALYTKTKGDIEIVEPKAHGLGYFCPPKDSLEGWTHETPQWIFIVWDWIIRGVLGSKRRRPSWFGLPVMMKLTLSTPHHALKNLAKGPLTRPNNFMMIPQIQRFGYRSNRYFTSPRRNAFPDHRGHCPVGAVSNR